ncbi:MAG: DNA-packaging protein [Rhizobiaceae bacterium]|nr:DNA-packaging protein [Rhizobiaceae bacterium]
MTSYQKKILKNSRKRSKPSSNKQVRGSNPKNSVFNAFLKTLSISELRALSYDWQLSARHEQLPPIGNWFTWLILGGRGAGKTRAGAEWVHDASSSGYLMNKVFGQKLTYGRIALVAETLSDAREVMVDGQSGILNIAKRNRPVYESSRRRLIWPNGAIAQIFSSEDPESLRGPQFDLAWCDELGKWKYVQETWDMLQFGLRLGVLPRQLGTTTPRPIELLKQIMEDPLTVITKMRTDDNKAHLAQSFLKNVHARYANTRLGRQELNGEVIADIEDALWQRTNLEKCRIVKASSLERIVVAIDPPVSATAKNSCCGIVVAGLDEKGIGIVLEDGSIDGASPTKWAKRAVELFHLYNADLVVAEGNQGGDMVRTVLQASDASLPIQIVHATRGKWVRAEPIAALYEQNRVMHRGAFNKLEDQMCNFSITGGANAMSPDRLDALVWALTALMLDPFGAPTIRSV